MQRISFFKVFIIDKFSNNLVIDALSRPNSPSEDGSVAQRGDVRVEGVARRDPNARSEEGQTFRPSSRFF
jgi:hypothetical protein